MLNTTQTRAQTLGRRYAVVCYLNAVGVYEGRLHKHDARHVAAQKRIGARLNQIDPANSVLGVFWAACIEHSRTLHAKDSIK